MRVRQSLFLRSLRRGRRWRLLRRHSNLLGCHRPTTLHYWGFDFCGLLGLGDITLLLVKYVLLVEHRVTELILKHTLGQVGFDSVLDQRHLEHLVHCGTLARVDTEALLHELLERLADMCG